LFLVETKINDKGVIKNLQLFTQSEVPHKPMCPVFG